MAFCGKASPYRSAACVVPAKRHNPARRHPKNRCMTFLAVECSDGMVKTRATVSDEANGVETVRAVRYTAVTRPWRAATMRRLLGGRIGAALPPHSLHSGGDRRAFSPSDTRPAPADLRADPDAGRAGAPVCPCGGAESSPGSFHRERVAGP